MNAPVIHDVVQNSDAWLELRRGIPTASSFAKLVTGTGKMSDSWQDYAAELAADAYAGKSLDAWEGNRWTERGHEMEPLAVAAYEFFRDAETEEAGFMVYQGAGASPDRLVGETGLLEIKSLSPKEHVKVLAYHDKHGKAPPKYYPQLQGEIRCCVRDWVDLAFFHPDLPLLVVRHDRDDGFISLLDEAIAKVCQRRDELLDVLSRA